MIARTDEEKRHAELFFIERLQQPIHRYDLIDAMKNLAEHAQGKIILNRYYSCEIIKYLIENNLWKPNHESK